MGKAIYLAIGATALLVATLSINTMSSVLATGDTQGRDGQSLMAEEIARSGLDMTVSRVSRDFDTWRDGLPVTPYGGGAFVSTAEGPGAGPVKVYAAGVVDDIDVQLTAWLARLASAPAALTVRSDSVAATLGGNAAVSGVDHSPSEPTASGEGYGHGDAVRGISASSANAASALSGAIPSAKTTMVRGIADQGDVQQESAASVLAAVLAEIPSAATASYASDQSFTNQTFGTDANPAIVVVDGDASFSNGGGVGVLYVKGSFQASGSFVWHGLVIAEGEGDMDFKMTGNATIYGAAYALHDGGGVEVSSSASSYPPLDAVTGRTGYGTSSQYVTWEDIGSVRVQSTFSTDASKTYSTGSFRGSTLQGFLGLANLDGRDLAVTGISNVEYTGPSEMPMLDVRPAVTNGLSRADITLTFGTYLPAQPLYLYVADIDWATMYIAGINASGAYLPSRTWTKTRSIDLITPDEGKRTTLSTGSSYATLSPNNSIDGEIIIDEITIPDPSAFKKLQFLWNSPSGTGDVGGIAISTTQLFTEETGGRLDVHLTGNAAIRYASGEIGRLASVLASVRAQSWIEAYDFNADTQVDRMTVTRRTTALQAGAVAGDPEYPYCRSGVNHEAENLMALIVAQIDGAVAGPCEPGVIDSGGDSDDDDTSGSGSSGSGSGSAGSGSSGSGSSGSGSGSSGSGSSGSGSSDSGSSGSGSGSSGSDSGSSDSGASGSSGSGSSGSSDSGASGSSGSGSSDSGSGSSGSGSSGSGSGGSTSQPSGAYVYCSSGTTQATDSYITYIFALLFGASSGACH